MNKIEEKNSQRSFLIDFLRVISSIGVVWLHVNGSVWTFTYETSWVQSWFIETILYWPVPVFFMITGITLMDYRKHYSTKEFIKKRMIRTFIPFLFWSVVSVFWSIYVSGYLPWDTKMDWKSWIDLIFNCRGMSIYWFFPALFTVYLSIPILSAIPKENRKNIFSYAVVYAIATISLPTLAWGVCEIPFNGELKTVVCGGYLMYVLMGYLIYNYEIKKKWRILIYILGVLGWLVRFWFGWMNSYAIGNVDGVYTGYLNLPCVLWSVAVFVFFRYMNLERLANSKLGKIISGTAKYCFGIYIIHYYLMWQIVKIFEINMADLSWKLYGVVVVYLISLVVTAILKKIPLVKKLMP